MKLGWKLVIRVLAGLLVLLFLAVGGLRVWVGHRLSADAIVAEMERNYNSRVEIGSRTLRVFSSWPARVEIDTVRMSPRDELADRGVPASQRPPLSEGVQPLRLDRAVVRMNLPDLIRGNLDIREVEFTGLRAVVLLAEDGDNIGPLFDKPELINGEPNPKLVERRLREEQREREREERRQARRDARDQARAEGTYEEWRAQDDAEREQRREREEEEEKEDRDNPFMAEDLKMRLLIDQGEITDAEISILTEDGATGFMLDEMRFGVSKVDVDPDALDVFNRAGLEVEGRLLVLAMRSGREIAEVRFTGEGPMRPFELGEGSWLPDIELEVALLEGSRFAGLPMFESLGKWFEVLATAGLSITGLDLAGGLVEDARTKVHYHDGLYTFIRRFDLVFENYRITIRGGAWINGSTKEHRIRGAFHGDKDWTEQTLGGIERFVRGLAGRSAAERFMNRVGEIVLDEDGRFRLDFTSQGSLSDPSVKIDQQLPDLRDAARDAGRDVLRNLLGGSEEE